MGVMTTRVLFAELGPCLRMWQPRTCKSTVQRSPVDHTCWLPRSWPHTCRCVRCDAR